jgi:hypothetical protein
MRMQLKPHAWSGSTFFAISMRERLSPCTRTTVPRGFSAGIHQPEMRTPSLEVRVMSSRGTVNPDFMYSVFSRSGRLKPLITTRSTRKYGTKPKTKKAAARRNSIRRRLSQRRFRPLAGAGDAARAAPWDSWLEVSKVRRV